VGRGNGMKENRDERQTAGGDGGEVNEDSHCKECSAHCYCNNGTQRVCAVPYCDD